MTELHTLDQTPSPEDDELDLSPLDVDDEEGDLADEAAPPPADDPPRPIREQAVGLSLPNSCMVYRCQARLEELHGGDQVLVALRDGAEVTGRVVYAVVLAEGETAQELLPGPVARLITRLSRADQANQRRLTEREAKAKAVCREQIAKLGLDMRLSKVTFDRDGNRAVFNFTAEQRVDFRELVRILAKRLRVRVEMRQIGVRDESRLLGGLGPCGQPLCCAQHMRSFHPVSVRMAKNQELSLNPEAISGVCGRLMCCLAHENDAYLELRSHLPKPNTRWLTKEGQEVVIKGGHPMKCSVLGQLADGSKQTFSVADLTPVEPGAPPATPPPERVAPPAPAARNSWRGRVRPPAATPEPEATPAPTTRPERAGGRPRPARPAAAPPPVEGGEAAEVRTVAPRRRRPRRRRPKEPTPAAQ